ncbi:hypothetical protein [Microbacterium rhizomatis]|uniref:Uncharacterized protein n=1 Tax=Microbacterium rhizomatis TaxID=1631477 RepID=A0A5J5IYD8_9MICO|nr:hypothetical protein [Microbacterium rhizomatis]KAA9104773.1 hypothetical protein F6B43_19040 [Microbacterium rhizomatis]
MTQRVRRERGRRVSSRPGQSSRKLLATGAGSIVNVASGAALRGNAAGTLLQLSTERLVMRVSRGQQKFESEVPSLQENTAARALTDRDDQTVLDGLRPRPLQPPAQHLAPCGEQVAERRAHLTDALIDNVTD